jgi:hypothetical protein
MLVHLCLRDQYKEKNQVLKEKEKQWQLFLALP